jgi:2-hydroxy-3-keto-5-methylthiopentenyl-1-phosphate phosphatase
MMRKAAILYDFDQTLCTRNMQEYSLLPSLHLSPGRFWAEVGQLARDHDMDPTLAYLYLLMKKAAQAGVPLTREALNRRGSQIEFFPGVADFFPRINDYARRHRLQLSHYVISSGNREIIEGCAIYPQFAKVFASSFHYDENGQADWPATAVNYTGKTQYLFRVSKNTLDNWDSARVNAAVADEQRDVPFDHMIYLGDGMTDVPCMRVVKANHGTAIGVYTDEKPETVRRLIEEDRVNYAAPADYRVNSRLDEILKTVLRSIAARDSLKKYEKV